jgi:YHS domain-containing protein
VKKSVIAVSIISALLIGSWASAADHATPPPQKQTVCPVMGGKIDKSLFADYEGKRVYFCCKGCPEKFKKDPAKYIQQLEKQGVTLDKAAAQTEHPAPAPGHEHSAHNGGGCCK